jgi:hypothetical protein
VWPWHAVFEFQGFFSLSNEQFFVFRQAKPGVQARTAISPSHPQENDGSLRILLDPSEALGVSANPSSPCRTPFKAPKLKIFFNRLVGGDGARPVTRSLPGLTCITAKNTTTSGA